MSRFVEYDQSIIDKFYEVNNKVDDSSFFTDATWEYLYDTTGTGSGIQRDVQWDTLPLKSQFVDWREMYAMLPLKLAPVGATGTKGYTLNPADCGLAPKGSTLSLINNHVMQTGAGKQLVSTGLGAGGNGLAVYNNVKLLTDYSINWSNQMGSMICYAKDTSSSGLIGTNAGMQQRSAYMLAQAAYASGGAGYTGTKANSDATSAIYYDAIIPLSLLSDFYDKLGAMVNGHFKLTLGLNFINNTNTIINGFAPFVYDSTLTVYPTISIVAPCRLYYRKYSLSAVEANRLSNAINSGFTKYVSWIDLDFATFSSSDTITNAGSAVQKVVSTSTVLPERLFVLGPISGSYANGTIPAPYNSVAKLNNVQIKINNVSYLDSPLQFQQELWEQYSACTLAGIVAKDGLEGSQVNYSDWLGNNYTGSGNANGISYSYYIFDISKCKDRIMSPNDAVNIQFLATKVDANAIDFYYVVEKCNTVKITFQGSKVLYQVGTNN